MKRYRPYAPHQSFLLPPSPSEWLPEGHLAYFVQELVGDLDLGEIERALQAKDARGERPYSPQMMTTLLMYGYSTGVFSARKLARATFEDVAFRVLAAGEHPHFTTINEFRNRHREALANLFGQVLRMCQSVGLVKLGHVALDGTKMKANASKHKAMSYDRMKKEESRIAAEVEALLAKAEQVDAEEDALYGVGEEPLDLPAELQRREDRIAKIREARAALEKEAKRARAAVLREQAVRLLAKAEQPIHSQRDRKAAATLAAQRDQQASLFDDDDPDPPASTPSDNLPVGTPPVDRNGEPTPKAQRNFTDPESRIMIRDGAFIQAYNAQIAVDEESQVIVAAALSNNAADAGYFEPLLWRTVTNCDAVPETVTADAGYFSESNIHVAEALGSEPFVSVGKHRNDGTVEDLPNHTSRLSQLRLGMRELLNSPRGRAIYARRKATVEPVFGQIRCCQGFQKLSFRGLLKSRCEWAFVALAHNVRKLFRASTAPKALAA